MRRLIALYHYHQLRELMTARRQEFFAWSEYMDYDYDRNEWVAKRGARPC
jgi:hypothetical protein